jgi:DNA-binding ferritin-like protein
MGSFSAEEYSEKISKIKSKASEHTTDALKFFNKMQEHKAEYSKKTEEMMTDATNDFEKIERDIEKHKDISQESRDKVREEIISARNQIRLKYEDLKARI